MRRLALALLVVASCRRSEPLPALAERGPLEVRAALERGAAIDEKASGRTALHVAAARADAELVALLIARGADVDAKDGSSSTPLQIAARRGATTCVGLLARSTKEIDATSGPKKRTALHDAVLAADADAVRAILAAHADVAAQDAEGKTALHLVAGADSFRAALIGPVLLAAGADPSTPEMHGMTSVHLAAHADDAAFLRLAPRDTLDLTTPLGETALDLALRYHRDAAAEILLLLGATTKRVPLVPPLHEAARTDDVLRASTLLGLGADASRIIDGKTALDVARERGSNHVAALLSAARP